MTRSEILQIVKPILFNTNDVRAILDGRKTVTRRVIKPAYPGGEILSETPPYKPGCYLYVRETWGIGNLFYDDEDIPNLCVCYKASEDRIDETCTTFKITDEQYEKYDNRMTMSMQDWYSCVSMPKEAARIFLRVKDVKVERLNEISINEIAWEGIQADYMLPAFHKIWDSTIKPKDRDKYGWAANPWVWVIEFERVEVTE